MSETTTQCVSPKREIPNGSAEHASHSNNTDPFKVNRAHKARFIYGDKWGLFKDVFVILIR